MVVCDSVDSPGLERRRVASALSLTRFSKGFSLSANQYVSAAIDVSFSTEAYQFTGVSANRLRRNSTVLQQSSSQKLESRPVGST
ncbi:hypothetical protein OIU78_010509 [Salix suchowensis]|nr:hypothetical protein OIU78_010509 [Salix suchowensis]